MRARTVTKVKEDQIPEILRTVRNEDLTLVTMINRVNPFMDRLMAALEGREPDSEQGKYGFDPVSGLFQTSPE